MRNATLNGAMKNECEHRERCMQIIQAVLDGSASATELEHFNRNIHFCRPCIEGYELEKSLKDALELRLERKKCPQDTVDAIMKNLGFSILMGGFVMYINS